MKRRMMYLMIYSSEIIIRRSDGIGLHAGLKNENLSAQLEKVDVEPP